METRLLTVELRYEHDVVLTRQRARQISGLLGFDVLDQTRIATAVSELARNAISYAERGNVQFVIDRSSTPALVVRIVDEGPGISDLRAVLDGRYVSRTGAGVGILGAKRLMDQFQIESNGDRGTVVTVGKIFPVSVVENIPERISNVVEELAKRSSQNPFEEIQRQNRELLSLMDDLAKREEELSRLNHELAETNRGVVALYSELDEKAGELTRASDQKTSFLSNMSHEFRTPLASIVSLTGLLLDELDGPLTADQGKQVSLIRRSAESLFSLVNDLLDMAKIEAGKTDVRPSAFEVADLFGALRGMFRPLLTSDKIDLIFDDPVGIPMLYTDEGKLSQVLRNFIANAVKFTEKGQITVNADVVSGREITFRVKDTGIGIPTQYHDRILQEFSQIVGPHQTSKLGTGLGLSLSRRLTQLLGGEVGMESSPGTGSIFQATIPMVYSGQNEPDRG